MKIDIKLLIAQITLVVIGLLSLWRLFSGFLPVSTNFMEIAQYDWLLNHKSMGIYDSRIVLVGLTDSDRRTMGSIPEDKTVAEIIRAVQRYNPKLIGLNFYRDLPVGQGREELLKVMDTTPNLIGLESASGTEAAILPPEILRNKHRTGDAMVPYDNIDRKLRRIFLYPDSFKIPSIRDYNLEYTRSWAWELARRYLMATGVEIQEPTEKDCYIRLKYPSGRVIQTKPLKYWVGDKNVFVPKFQVLMNWPIAKKGFRYISFTNVLNGIFDSSFIRDKIVLIGALYDNYMDLNVTPVNNYATKYGLAIHAIALSNLLNLENQGFIYPIQRFWAYIWMVVWIALSGCGIFLATSLENSNSKEFITNSVIITLFILSALSFIIYWLFGHYWIPSAITMIGVVINAVVCMIFVLQDQMLIQQLEHLKKLAQKDFQNKKIVIWQQLAHEKSLTEQYKALAQDFEQKFLKAQEKLKAQERLAFLGKLVSATHHHTKNYIQAINFRLSVSKDIFEEGNNLLEAHDLYSEIFADYLQENWNDLKLDNDESLDLLNRLSTQIDRCLPFFGRNDSKNNIFLGVDTQIIIDIALQEFLESCYLDGIYRLKFDAESNFKVNLIKNLQNLTFKGHDIYLRYVFINLIENAYEALLDKFAIEAYDPFIELSCYAKSEGIYISIKDNGIGIPIGQEDSIFQPFITTRKHGTGLGLSLSLDIVVSLYHGDIRYNRTNGNTEFIVFLPNSNDISES